MITEQQAASVIGGNAYSSDGEKIGKIAQVYLDDETGQPEFVTVNTGLFGMSETFVLVADARIGHDGLALPYTLDMVNNAPRIDTGGAHLDGEERQRLYEHYDRSHPTESYSATDGYSGSEFYFGTESYSGARDDVAVGEGAVTGSG